MIIAKLKKGQGGGRRGGEWDALVGFALHSLKIRNDIMELSNGTKIPIYQKVLGFQILQSSSPC